MSVLVYAESWEGKFRKSTYETISYASETAKNFGKDVLIEFLRLSTDIVAPDIACTKSFLSLTPIHCFNHLLPPTSLP